MKWMWRKFGTLLAVSYADMLAYRAAIYLWALSSVMPFIMMGIWTQASAGGQMDMQPVDFARYFLSVFIVRQISLVWVIYEFERQVVEGRLSPYLLQPINPVWRFLANHLGERLARLPFLVVLAGFFFLLYPESFWIPSGKSALLAVAAIMLAFALRFLMQYTFAMISFWSERANAIDDLWHLFYLFLSGYIAPLDVFPPAVRDIAMLTPFPYLMYMPAQLLAGREVDVVRGFSVSLAWGAAFFVLYRILWKQGLRHYSAMGA